jgi:hypothetical protein
MQIGTSPQTTLTVKKSTDPEKPLTVSFLAVKPDEDGARSGFEMDLTLDDARAMARLVLEGVRLSASR